MSEHVSQVKLDDALVLFGAELDAEVNCIQLPIFTHHVDVHQASLYDSLCVHKNWHLKK